jgi:phosphatidylglycerophosphate synthase
MFDVYLRNVKDYFYENIFNINLLKKLKLTPNKITLIGFLIGLLSSLFCYFENMVLAFSLWVINRVLDGLDGKMFITY